MQIHHRLVYVSDPLPGGVSRALAADAVSGNADGAVLEDRAEKYLEGEILPEPPPGRWLTFLAHQWRTGRAPTFTPRGGSPPRSGFASGEPFLG